MTCQAPFPRLQAAILKDAGVLLMAGMRVLDLGCGNGNGVRGRLDMGFYAYDCDFTSIRGQKWKLLSRMGGSPQLERVHITCPIRIPMSTFCLPTKRWST